MLSVNIVHYGGNEERKNSFLQYFSFGFCAIHTQRNAKKRLEVH